MFFDGPRVARQHELKESRSARSETTDDSVGILGGLASLGVVALVAGGGRLIGLLWDHLPFAALANPKHPFVVFAVAVAILIVGRALFYVREHCLQYYALLEIGSGALIGIEGWLRYIPNFNNEPWPAIVSLLGAVYIVVRGFDNRAKHRKAVQDAALAQKAADAKQLSVSAISPSVDVGNPSAA